LLQTFGDTQWASALQVLRQVPVAVLQVKLPHDIGAPDVTQAPLPLQLWPC
jgi:hypothetical protein